VGSAALAGAAFIVGVVVGWLLRPFRRGAVLTAFGPVVSQLSTTRPDAIASNPEESRTTPEIVEDVATTVAAPPLMTETATDPPELTLSEGKPVASAGPVMQPPPVVKRKERETTVLVCGFGSAPTDADVPANVLRCLTDLQKVLSGIVGDEGGTVDRFAGDRLIAVFAAKRKNADHAGRAVEAAKRIASNVGALSRRLRYDLRIAIGIHSGSLPLDDRGHVDAAAIGAAIDVAGRLEVYAKGSDVTIAFTESVAERAEAEEGSFDLLGEAAVGSEGLPVRVFTPRQRA
jgi:class 3 adenylate cyclase